MQKSILNLRAVWVLPLLLLLPPAVSAQHYTQTNLVSSIPGVGSGTLVPIPAELAEADEP